MIIPNNNPRLFFASLATDDEGRPGVALHPIIGWVLSGESTPDCRSVRTLARPIDLAGLARADQPAPIFDASTQRWWAGDNARGKGERVLLSFLLDRARGVA
jgi:hypothetical protein